MSRRAVVAACALIAFGLVTCFTMPVRAAESRPVVANVIAIDGSLSVKRPDQPNWFAGYVQMPDYVQDHLKTDASSLAALEFKVGGKIGINKGTEVEIVGPRDVTDVTRRGAVEKLVLKSGTIWAKFTKQQEQFKIQTESTVIGIRGTEFVVETGASKETTISVLEGEVSYTTEAQKSPEDTGAQKPDAAVATGVAKPGDKITIAYQQVPVVKQYSPDDLRKETEAKYPELNNWFVRQILYTAASYVPYGGLAVDIVSDPNNAAMAIASQAASHVPGGGILIGVLGSASKPKPKEPDFPNGMAPDQCDANPDALTFSWKKFKDANKYLLLVSRDEKMQALDWSANVEGESATYPADGMPLAPGEKYYWRLIALDDKGKPKGKASQTWFQVPSSYTPAPATNQQ